MSDKILKLCNCGGFPKIEETWDKLRIYCPKCGKTIPTIYGDYYDEAFMFATYGERAIKEWNRRAGEEGKQ